MQLDHPSSDKIRSIKQLRLQLLSLTKELNKTTEQLQLLELHEIGSDQPHDENIHPEEISELIRKQNKISHEIITVKKRIQKLSAKTILKVELIVLPILAILLFYGTTNHYQTNILDPTDPLKTRYLIENLQGQAGDTYKHWNIAENTPLTVSIVNPDHLSQEKINVIKEAILSTTPMHINNDLLGKSPQDGTSEYYEGWKGALNTIKGTEFYVPNQFSVIESDSGPGQIVIVLSHLEDPDGYSGYTRSVVDDSQILKSFITIYDADKLSDNRLAAVVRHEFGHALGLPHANDPQDLMHATIQTNYPYISECDITAVQSLYDGNTDGNAYCRTNS
ncbi:MAG: matrixin family metalloprotease [Thaumarchaeota archaeon]|nr:matrixin family metalloprotease [Nitrososphaerota archaeon]